jgi:hypothetical protein
MNQALSRVALLSSALWTAWSPAASGQRLVPIPVDSDLVVMIPAPPSPVGYMFEPSSESVMQWGDVTGDGAGENLISVDTIRAAATNVCRRFLIPIFLPSGQCEPVAGRFCQRALGFPSFFISRTICTTVNTPPMDWRMRQDTSSTINTAILSGSYDVVDASTVSTARDTTVAFGIPFNPRFSRPEDSEGAAVAARVDLDQASKRDERVAIET